jgi:hypothetical protein
MNYIVAHIYVNGQLSWENLGKWPNNDGKGITINFPLYGQYTANKAKKTIMGVLEKNNITWLCFNKPYWLFSCSKFKEQFPEYKEENWLKGDLALEAEYDPYHDDPSGTKRTGFAFVITPEIIKEQLPKRIFLSHKTVDKFMARRYKKALEAIGLLPWLDEDDMPAGTNPDRGILNGFKNSCAAVFFITPDFKDERFLEQEINYAIQEKREKADQFSIITLVLQNASGERGKVPELLKSYIFKSPNDALEGFCEIIKALPLKIGLPTWKFDL